MDDGVNTVEQVLESGSHGQLVVNQASLQGFLGSHNDDSLRSSSADTAKEVVGSSFVSQNVLLHESVCTESDVVLGDGEHKQGAVALVQAHDAVGLDGVLDDADGTHGVLFFVELHNSLGVLGGVSA